MSAAISPNSPKIDPSFAELIAFDGAEELGQAWRDGLRPDPALTVSEWADRHVSLVLVPPRNPVAIEPTVRPTFGRSRMRFGFTEAGNNWIGYVIHHAPGPMLAVQPTVELAKRFSRQRIDPLISESPALRERVKPARSRDAGNTMRGEKQGAVRAIIS